MSRRGLCGLCGVALLLLPGLGAADPGVPERVVDELCAAALAGASEEAMLRWLEDRAVGRGLSDAQRRRLAEAAVSERIRERLDVARPRVAGVMTPERRREAEERAAEAERLAAESRILRHQQGARVAARAAEAARREGPLVDPAALAHEHARRRRSAEAAEERLRRSRRFEGAYRAGRARADQGDCLRALEGFAEALPPPPLRAEAAWGGEDTARLALARCLEQLGAHLLAFRVYGDVLARGPGADGFVDALAFAESRGGLLGPVLSFEARAGLRELPELAVPREVRDRFSIFAARRLMEDGLWREAGLRLLGAVRSAEFGEVARYELGRTYAVLGHPAAARDQLAPLAEARDPRVRAAARRARALIDLAQRAGSGEGPVAAEAEAGAGLAWMHHAAGSPREAQQAAERARGATRGLARLRLELLEAYLALVLGDEDAAARATRFRGDLQLRLQRLGEGEARVVDAELEAEVPGLDRLARLTERLDAEVHLLDDHGGEALGRVIADLQGQLAEARRSTRAQALHAVQDALRRLLEEAAELELDAQMVLLGRQAPRGPLPGSAVAPLLARLLELSDRPGYARQCQRHEQARQLARVVQPPLGAAEHLRLLERGPEVCDGTPGQAVATVDLARHLLEQGRPAESADLLGALLGANKGAAERGVVPFPEAVLLRGLALLALEDAAGARGHLTWVAAHARAAALWRHALLGAGLLAARDGDDAAARRLLQQYTGQGQLYVAHLESLVDAYSLVDGGWQDLVGVLAHVKPAERRALLVRVLGVLEREGRRAEALALLEHLLDDAPAADDAPDLHARELVLRHGDGSLGRRAAEVKRFYAADGAWASAHHDPLQRERSRILVAEWLAAASRAASACGDPLRGAEACVRLLRAQIASCPSCPEVRGARRELAAVLDRLGDPATLSAYEDLPAEDRDEPVLRRIVELWARSPRLAHDPARLLVAVRRYEAATGGLDPVLPAALQAAALAVKRDDCDGAAPVLSRILAGAADPLMGCRALDLLTHCQEQRGASAELLSRARHAEAVCATDARAALVVSSRLCRATVATARAEIGRGEHARAAGRLQALASGSCQDEPALAALVAAASELDAGQAAAAAEIRFRLRSATTTSPEALLALAADGERHARLEDAISDHEAAAARARRGSKTWVTALSAALRLCVVSGQPERAAEIEARLGAELGRRERTELLLRMWRLRARYQPAETAVVALVQLLEDVPSLAGLGAAVEPLREALRLQANAPLPVARRLVQRLRQLGGAALLGDALAHAEATLSLRASCPRTRPKIEAADLERRAELVAALAEGCRDDVRREHVASAVRQVLARAAGPAIAVPALANLARVQADLAEVPLELPPVDSFRSAAQTARAPALEVR